MNNISNIYSCYGCGVCAIACGKKIIKIHLNDDGFYQPYITDTSKCVECGLCREVCSYLHNDTALANSPKGSFGAWSKETGVRRVSASGGVGFEIGRSLIRKGYKVVSVRYSIKNKRAEHYVANSVEEFLPSMGSKYIQSYTLEGFSAINRKEKYLVTGTPCQIDSFRRYIRKFKCEDNFVLMDFFCHGVPSLFVWKKYLSEIQKKLGCIDFVSWRNKLNGWHDSWAMAIDSDVNRGECVDWYDSYNLLIREKKGFVNSRWTQGDTFYSMFLGNNCLGKACYKKCKFKYNHSSADIRIGDMWGDTYKDEDKGVTACAAFTDTGLDILHSTNCELMEYPFEQIAEGQIKKPIKYPLIGWNIIIALAKNRYVTMKILVFVNWILGKLNNLLRKI